MNTFWRIFALTVTGLMCVPFVAMWAATGDLTYLTQLATGALAIGGISMLRTSAQQPGPGDTN